MKLAKEETVRKTIERHGLSIGIERLKGSVRTGVDAQGKPWKRIVALDYGHIPGSIGADGDALDVFVGPDKDAENVYVVHQNKASGKYDEDKLFVGLPSAAAAKKKYLDQYPVSFFGSMSTVTVDRLKELLAENKKLEKISHAMQTSFLDELRAIGEGQ